MRRLCERPGCSDPAQVSYGIDKSRLLVWVDNRAPAERELTGRLCRRHADSLVVPRGWSLDDRREPVPLLFAAAHLVDSSGGAERPASPDTSRPVRRSRPEGIVLPLFEERHHDRWGDGLDEQLHDDVHGEFDGEHDASFGEEIDDVPESVRAPDDVWHGEFHERIDSDGPHDSASSNDSAGRNDNMSGDGTDDTVSWLQRLERRFEPSPADDEEPTLGRLMGRAFGRPRLPDQNQ